MGTPALWIGFLVCSTVLIGLDLLLTRGQSVTPRKAAIWTCVWVGVSLAFAAGLAWRNGPTIGVTWLTAYIIEYALSVDNLFVFIVVFSYFGVPPPAQHRLLYWGIVGAFIMRGVLIGLGTTLVAQFT